MQIKIAPIHQQVPTDRINDPAEVVRAGLRALPLSNRVQPGMRICLALPSRGISCLIPVVEAAVSVLQSLRAEVFIVPAMGSHGGSTAQGQREVLESYGVKPPRINVPILSDMQAVDIGRSPEGIRIFFDSYANQADGIILINRIKEHTAFKASWESGLMKIMAVGLGKPAGAAEIHNHGVKDAMPAVARTLLKLKPILAGIGIVENGRHEPAKIAVLPAESIETEEPELLNLARSMLPRIPFEPVDLLIVQEMGKDLSGTGMDLNVIGMWRRIGGPIEPKIDIIGVLDLTEKSHGNAIGVGHADLITQRLLSKIDLHATNKNCLTAHNFAGAKIPITLPSDRDVILTGLSGLDPLKARAVFIRNTLDLETFWVAEALLQKVESNPNLKQLGVLRNLSFDENGTIAHNFGEAG